jgi:hypothetical protein
MEAGNNLPMKDWETRSMNSHQRYSLLALLLWSLSTSHFAEADVLFLDVPEDVAARVPIEYTGKWKWDSGEFFTIADGSSSKRATVRLLDSLEHPVPASGMLVSRDSTVVIAVSLDLKAGVNDLSDVQGIILGFAVPVWRLYRFDLAEGGETIEVSEISAASDRTRALLEGNGMSSMSKNDTLLIDAGRLTQFSAEERVAFLESFQWSRRMTIRRSRP